MDHFELVSEYAPTGDQPQAIARLVEGLLKRWPGPCHCAMLGLTAAAPAVILLELNPAGTTIMEALVGLEAAIWGFAVAHELGEGE